MTPPTALGGQPRRPRAGLHGTHYRSLTPGTTVDTVARPTPAASPSKPPAPHGTTPPPSRDRHGPRSARSQCLDRARPTSDPGPVTATGAVAGSVRPVSADPRCRDRARPTSAAGNAADTARPTDHPAHDSHRPHTAGPRCRGRRGLVRGGHHRVGASSALDPRQSPARPIAPAAATVLCSFHSAVFARHASAAYPVRDLGGEPLREPAAAGPVGAEPRHRDRARPASGPGPVGADRVPGRAARVSGGVR
ncbi:hypothetical protein CLV40_13327 [Actinokineospora auranticolor]|uniref:Uncharacterized protein n=1 Tax=Actinokineospora auranticolor TaxID=155976 RepID=A0A2S6GD53_9PSEU|nr:hypothetical protein CLV40_13327 [Actinokineospora auranticolor]